MRVSTPRDGGTSRVAGSVIEDSAAGLGAGRLVADREHRRKEVPRLDINEGNIAARLS